MNQQVFQAKKDHRVHMDHRERKEKEEIKVEVAVPDHQARSDKKTKTQPFPKHLLGNRSHLIFNLNIAFSFFY